MTVAWPQGKEGLSTTRHCPQHLGDHEFHVTGSIQAVMADGGEIKGQAEVCRAELHNLRPVALLPQKGEERGEFLPHHCPQGKAGGGVGTEWEWRKDSQLCLNPLLVGATEKSLLCS